MSHRSDIYPIIMSDAQINVSSEDMARAPSPVDASLTIDAGFASPDLSLMIDMEPLIDMESLIDMEPPIDMALTSAQTCSEEDLDTDCLFGSTSRSLIESQSLQVTSESRHTEADTMSSLHRDQLVFGFACEGIFAPQTAEEAFTLIDVEGVHIYRIQRPNSDLSYTWHRFYMGDTEVGYLFRHGTLQSVAQVSDQGIIRCSERR